MEQVGQQNFDELLLPFVEAADEATAQSLLGDLISLHAEPVIRKVIAAKLRLSSSGARVDADARGNADDVKGDVTVNLLARLRECRASPLDKPIADFRNYVAVAAYRACYEYLRRKYPERHKLKNRVRYALQHDDSFAVWEGDGGELLCGFRRWQGKHDRARSPVAESLSSEESRRLNLAEALKLIFTRCDSPVEIDELVSLLADRLGIADTQRDAFDHGEHLDRLPDARADFTQQTDQRQRLRVLWAEICELPSRQRTALLLNLKDEEGRGCIALFQLTGVATLRQMAEVLGMTLEEFADLWNELPLEDAKIAGLLALTRQQVINLRKSARARLARRLKAY